VQLVSAVEFPSWPSVLAEYVFCIGAMMEEGSPEAVGEGLDPGMVLVGMDESDIVVFWFENEDPWDMAAGTTMALVAKKNDARVAECMVSGDNEFI
jgi:hypothetical protein